ncbi:hypothetical protein FO497_29215 [Bacillus cereus ATCC 10876]|uniref:hypothetical protein n=1 Tax=Bacillus TaxID=1386 RepID=UPI00019FF0D1|nr:MULTISPECIES: hypothetical protein [Bacillus]MDJ0281007.1 hypothetical protein [Bacillus bombysepticus]EEK50736.1 hypothetical protein bcere0002_22360 [Bacillus cereus ATCC 10876]KFL74808.1 hypothetical protein DJ50_1110 [Bacillus cereus ATCC 10876]MBG9868769.1 hypothetical protein [Bacillus cereus]MBO1127963.1 hypothetical protein [Bacillus cereus]
MSEPNKQYTNIELEMILDNFVKALPMQMRMQREMSKLYKARYDALVSEGFTEQQALEIVKLRGIE